MQSQVAGIAWISIALLFIAALAIFLPKETKNNVGDSHKTMTDTAVFEKMKEERGATENKRERRKGRERKTREENRRTERDTTASGGFPCYSPTHTTYKKQPLTVELNGADTTTLQLLHGIGPAYARRIVRYRERLGGFSNKEQLLEVYGFTPELLSHIAPYITIDTLGISKMDINSIALKQLIKHPYIEYYQARDIVNLRNRGVRFKNAEDLRAVPSMADSTLERLLPYLLFD